MSATVGENRASGFWRVAAVLVLVVTQIWTFIALIGIAAGVIFAIVDALWFQLILNEEGWTPNTMGGVAGFLLALWRWPWDMARWIFLGEGMFPWHPWA